MKLYLIVVAPVISVFAHAAAPLFMPVMQDTNSNVTVSNLTAIKRIYLGTNDCPWPNTDLSIFHPTDTGYALSIAVNGIDPWFHINHYGIGAVGNNVTIPYIAVENSSTQDVAIDMRVSSAALNYGYIATRSSTGQKPQLRLLSDSTMAVGLTAGGQGAPLFGLGTYEPHAMLDIATNQASGSTNVMQRWSYLGDTNNWGLRLEQAHDGAAIYYYWRLRNGSTDDITPLAFSDGNTVVGEWLVVSKGSRTPVLDIPADPSIPTTNVMQRWRYMGDTNNWGLRLEQAYTGSSVYYYFRLRNGSTDDVTPLGFVNGNTVVGQWLSTGNGVAVGGIEGNSSSEKVILQDGTTNLHIFSGGILISNIANYHD